MNIKLDVQKIEFIYDDLDTNAINFILVDGGYFCIQTGVYLEADEVLNLPSFEYNDQGNSQFGGLKNVTFSNQSIRLTFSETEPFIKKYSDVDLHIKEEISRKIVDFFANHLFLGSALKYDADFEESKKVIQTVTREYLE